MTRYFIAALVGTLAVAPPASADTEECARAYESAQVLRRDAKLQQAKEALLVCAQDSCPAILRKDCVAWLAQVERELPSLAMRVRGPDGCDRPDAVIHIDGVVSPGAAEGRPVSLDPGTHTVRATWAAQSSERTVVVAAGESGRLVTLTLGDPARVCQVPPAAAAERKNVLAPAPASKPTPPLVYAAAGVGIVSLGLSVGFGISAWSQKGELDTCKGHCAAHDVDVMRRTFLVADVAGVVAIASLAVAAVVFLHR